MSEPTSGWYRSQRLKLHYTDWGNPDSPLLLMVHGMADHSRSWDALAAQLRDRYRVVAVDLRGHGDSEWSRDCAYGLLDYAFDLRTLVDHLGAERVTLVAHSMGGSVSLIYAGVHPEKVERIVAIEGLGPSPRMIDRMNRVPVHKRVEEWMDKARDYTARPARALGDVPQAAARMREVNPHLSEALSLHLAEHGTRRDDAGALSWKRDPAARAFHTLGMTHNTMHELWARIACPMLLLYGADSEASNPAEDGRLGYLQDARLIHMEQAGHFVHHDQFDKTLAAVEGFLSPSSS